MIKQRSLVWTAREIIIFLVLPYQPKKNRLLVYGGSDIYGIWKNTARYIQHCSQAARLNTYLADIDTQRKGMERAHRTDGNSHKGITEQLKSESALEWVQRMNNIRACAKGEIVERVIFA